MHCRKVSSGLVTIGIGATLLFGCGGGGGTGSDRLPPTVSITAPGEGTVVRDSLAVAAEASDESGILKVELAIDGTLVGSDNEAPYLFQLDLNGHPAGRLQLRARAWDNAGNPADVSISISNDREDPYLGIAEPLEGAVVADRVEFVLAVTDDVGIENVRIGEGDVEIALLGPGSGWRYSWDCSTSAAGPRHLRLTALDLAGRSAERYLDIVRDAQAPEVQIVPFADQRPLYNSDLELWARVQDDVGIEQVQVAADGGPGVAMEHGAGDLFRGVLKAAEIGSGSHRFVVTALDRAGRLAEAETAAVFDVDPPTLSLLAPAELAAVQSSFEMRLLTEDENGIARILFSADGVELGRIDDPATAEVAASLDLSELVGGVRVVVVESVDTAGNVARMSRSLVHDLQAPVVAVEPFSPGGGFIRDDVEALITVEDDSGVERVTVSVDGGRPEVVPSPVEGAWRWTVPGGTLGEGSHALLVEAVDLSGRTGTATVDFGVDRTPPSVVVLSPADGVRLTGMRSGFGIAFELSIDDPLSGPGRIEVRQDDRPEPLLATTGDHTGFAIDAGLIGSGEHRLHVTVTDRAGNAGGTTVDLELDFVPGVELIEPESLSTIARRTAAKVRATDDHAIRRVELMWDATILTDCPAGAVPGEYVCTHDFSEPADRDGVLSIRATDDAGETGSFETECHVEWWSVETVYQSADDPPEPGGYTPVIGYRGPGEPVIAWAHLPKSGDEADLDMRIATPADKGGWSVLRIPESSGVPHAQLGLAFTSDGRLCLTAIRNEDDASPLVAYVERTPGSHTFEMHPLGFDDNQNAILSAPVLGPGRQNPGVALVDNADPDGPSLKLLPDVLQPAQVELVSRECRYFLIEGYAIDPIAGAPIVYYFCETPTGVRQNRLARKPAGGQWEFETVPGNHPYVTHQGLMLEPDGGVWILFSHLPNPYSTSYDNYLAWEPFGEADRVLISSDTESPTHAMALIGGEISIGHVNDKIGKTTHYLFTLQGLVQENVTTSGIDGMYPLPRLSLIATPSGDPEMVFFRPLDNTVVRAMWE